MNRCLCCGKPLIDGVSDNNWHPSCIKKFFGTSVIPYIDVSEETIDKLAVECTNKGFTVPGVQKKLSLHLTKGTSPRLTLVNYPTGYILKPNTKDYVGLPEMEYLIMQMARISGIKTVPFGLLKIPTTDVVYAYITKRIDRQNKQILAMEDFCQLSNKPTSEKYHGSYERCGKIIKDYSHMKGIDRAEFYCRLVFSFVVGNSDMHLKNFSLIETQEGSGIYELSAAYDMLSTNVVLPSDEEEMALALNGKKKNIHSKDFYALAESLELPKNAAQKIIKQIVDLEGTYIEMCEQSFLPDDMKDSLIALIKTRIAVLS